MKRFTLPLLALVAVFALGACSEDPMSPQENAGSDGPALEATAVDLELRPGGDTIADTADAEGFTLLLAAVDYIAATNPQSPLVAGLLDRVQYTVFAPTDTAFENLVGAVSGQLDPEILAADGPFAAIDDLLGEGTIEAVVSYHVVEGRRSARSVQPPMGERTLMTLLPGASFTVSASGEISAVGSSATIDPADVSASNGIIHVIDAVLLPVDLGL